jgi:hypothetical protein
MTRHGITDDQKEIAIELLANALRKDAHLRSRPPDQGQRVDMVQAGIARRRAESSQRYIDGMRDMLRVLFPNGAAIAEACMDEAYLRAMGIPRGDRSGSDHQH